MMSKEKHPCYCFTAFVAVWPASEVLDGIFEVCPSTTKFCPLVNNCRVTLDFFSGDDKFLTKINSFAF